ncbi:peptide-N-glycosidase F-related protein [Bacteroidota bacterium]|nr:peptide-N-glycosidase F-related protein [Bacteroidota bacterium]
MKNLFKLLICTILLTCGSDDESENNVINLPASISVNVSSLSFENTMVNQISESQVIIIDAENTSSEVNISAPEGYEVSSDNSSFSQSFSFVPEISNEIYIRFTPAEAVNYYSTLVISSNDISNNININLFGLGTPLIHNYQAFQNQALGYGGGFSQSASQMFSLHDDLSDIQQIKMYLQIDCPSTGCDDWDRFANVKVKDQATGNWYEIARYITPYWVGTQQLQRGLEFDVTDFKSFLKDNVELRIYIENWTTKADIVSIDFDYIVGTPDYENYEVAEVLSLHSNSISGVPYGVTHNLDLEKSIQIPSDSENIQFRTIISGWGHATPYDADGRPCAEWCFRTHDIKINGSNTFQHSLGPIGCSANPINNQNPGNWQPDRAGWCPGMAVPVRMNSLETSYSGSTISFEYDFEDWTSDGNGGNAFYAISTYIIVKSNSEITAPVVTD